VRIEDPVARQALLMLNSEEVANCARSAAESNFRVLIETPNARLDYVFRQILMVISTDSGQRSLFIEYLGRDLKPVDAWQDIYQTLFGSAEFRALD
jgi:hypothetical protein